MCTIDENQAALDIDSAIARIKEEFYPVLSSSRKAGKKGKKGGDNIAPIQEIMMPESAQASSEEQFIPNEENDFITVSESEEEVDDMPQNVI